MLEKVGSEDESREDEGREDERREDEGREDEASRKNYASWCQTYYSLLVRQWLYFVLNKL